MSAEKIHGVNLDPNMVRVTIDSITNKKFGTLDLPQSHGELTTLASALSSIVGWPKHLVVVGSVSSLH